MAITRSDNRKQACRQCARLEKTVDLRATGFSSRFQQRSNNRDRIMAFRPSLALAFALSLACLPVSAPAADGVSVTAAMLPQTGLSAGMLTRDAAFVHRFFRPEKPSGNILILLHGSGGDETTLVSVASRIAPDATLIGIRGRIVQDGINRWYKRITPTEFDQQDVRAEAAAFARFLRGMADAQKLDLSAATFLGYSNGANLIAALTQLDPGLVRKAVLLRPMPVLSETANVDLSQTRVLTIAGQNDQLYFPFAPRLEELLRGCGADVDARTIASGHGIGDEDARIAAEWLGSAAR